MEAVKILEAQPRGTSDEHASDLARAHGGAGLTGAAGTADGGRVDLRQADGDVQLGLAQGCAARRPGTGLAAPFLVEKGRPNGRGFIRS